ncbi:MAG: polysaccharide deacetylase family protein [Pseudohongiellaceae bacterium]
MNRKTKNQVKFIMAELWSLFARKNTERMTIPILCYHSINSRDSYEADPLSPEYFEAHLDYLSQNYNVIPLDQAANYIERKQCDVDNPVVITFDDGYVDNYEVAFPLLKKFRLPATIFVVTGFVNRNLLLIDDPNFGPLSWDQIREMDMHGLVTFGAHSDTHRILSNISDAEVQNEIIMSKSILEDELGHDIDLFAYPNGQMSDIPPSAINVVEEKSFRCACSTFWRCSQKHDEKWVLNRVMISGGDTLDVFKYKVFGYFDYIYYLQKIKFIIQALFRSRIKHKVKDTGSYGE